MPKHILLVDDEVAVRGAVAMLLMIDGHTIIEAGSGEEALERFRQEAFDLVITDFKMPGATHWQRPSNAFLRPSRLSC